MIISAITLCFITHELGHWLSARVFGYKINFRFSWGWLFNKIPIPRFIWDMPEADSWKQRIIAMSGFGIEFLFAMVSYCVFPQITIYSILAFCLHIGLYKFYAGVESDFKYF